MSTVDDTDVAGEHFDAVVIGSGFGGSVSAFRLAEARLRTCLFERGRAYPPGSFARSPHRMKRNFWDPSAGLYGLFNAWSFGGLGALVSSGLGGGSLIYANVLLRKDEHWFVHEEPHGGPYEHWPVTYADLECDYDAVEKILAPQKYPLHTRPYCDTPKTVAMRQAAAELNLEWALPPLGVTFANGGDPPIPGEPITETHANIHGRTRSTCRLCGECDIGCNYGSKNTLDYNYLSAAQRAGAIIKTLCEVRSFSPRSGGGYTITYVQHDLAREGEPMDTRQLPLRSVTADALVLAAGTLGSNYLFLANREAFPDASRRLGKRFSGNGDLLTLAMKSGANTPRTPRVLDASYGPVITSYIRVPDTAEGGTGRGFYIQDAGYPEFVNWMIQLLDTPNDFQRVLHFTARWLRGLLGLEADRDLGAEFGDLLGEAVLSKSSLPLLGMGRDIPGGQMFLREGFLDVDWRLDGSRDYFERVRSTMEDVATQMGATFVDNPVWYLSRLITVHPLGGCAMARDTTEGVVDKWGRVFGYPGLVVADGSVMPGPVGANPSLTIAALANRFATQLIDDLTTGRIPRGARR